VLGGSARALHPVRGAIARRRRRIHVSLALEALARSLKEKADDVQRRGLPGGAEAIFLERRG
jgi:hypothetical protein